MALESYFPWLYVEAPHLYSVSSLAGENVHTGKCRRLARALLLLDFDSLSCGVSCWTAQTLFSSDTAYVVGTVLWATPPTSLVFAAFLSPHPPAVALHCNAFSVHSHWGCSPVGRTSSGLSSKVVSFPEIQPPSASQFSLAMTWACSFFALTCVG